MQQEQFLKKLGLRYPGDLINPKVIDLSDVVLPKDSIYIYLGDNGPEHFSSSPLIENATRVKLFSLTSYAAVNRGKFRKLNVKPQVINKLIQKEHDNVEPVLQKTRLATQPQNVLVAINAKILDEMYRYTLKVDTDYSRSLNKLETVVKETGDRLGMLRRKRYIEIPIPSVVSQRTDYERAIRYTGVKAARAIKSYREYVILELFKALDPKEYKGSIFREMSSAEANNTVLVFTIANKATFVPLGKLLGMMKEVPFDAKVATVAATTLKKMLLLHVLKIVQMTPLSVNDAINDTRDTTKIDEMLDEVLDGEIDTHIDTYVEMEIELDKRTDDTASNVSYHGLTKKTVKKDVAPVDIARSTLDDHLESGSISEATFKKQVKALDAKVTTPTDVDTTLSVDKHLLKHSITIPDESYLVDSVSAFDKDYINDVFKKDQAAVIDHFTTTGNVVTEHTITEEKNILSATEEHQVTFKTLAGRESTVKVKLPIISPEGTFRLRGNTYRMRKQKMDAPIRKIDSETVTLSSYYSKLFVKKRDTRVNDSYTQYYKKLLSRNGKGSVRRLIAGKNNYIDLALPVTYTGLGKYLASLVVNGVYIEFNYNNRLHLLPEGKKIDSVEKDGLVLVGKKDTTLYLIDHTGFVITFDGKFNKTGDTFLDLLGLRIDDAHPDVSTIMINRTRIPLVLILIYYYGFSSLLKLLDATFRVEEKRSKLEPNEYDVRIGEVFYVFDRNDADATLLFAGLRRVEPFLREVDYRTLDLKSGVENLFSIIGYNKRLRNDIKLLQQLWLDPITKATLIEMKEPANFVGLLLRANELLTTDYAKHPNSVEEVQIKGYERLNGMLYAEMAHMMRDYTHKRGVVRAKLSMQPYAVINKIMNDSTTILIDDKNPIASLKQDEDVTYLGTFGRSKETLTQSSREFHSSEVGLTSEATKDSGEVGVNTYLSASPQIANLRGKKATGKLSPVNVLSTSAMLAPFSSTDDSKRLGFISIQNQHVIAIDNATTLPVRTGYEAVFSQRVSKKFVMRAEADGEVTSVSDKQVVIKYKDGSKKYKLASWTTKEESGTTFKHIMVSDLKRKSKIKKNEVIGYDKTFFAKDLFDPTMVIMKNSILVRTVMIDREDTIEDAGTVSNRLSKKLKVSYQKVRQFKLTTEDDIVNMIGIGKSVVYDSPLFTLVGNINTENLTKDQKKELLELTSKNPKAKIVGTIDKLEVFYNCELKQLPKSLRTIAIESDKRLEETVGSNGRVSSEFSFHGKPLKDGEYVVKIYIATGGDIEPGDKAILANQLKFTVSNTFSNNEQTEDGQPFDLKFSITSIEARVVNSPDLIGTTSTIADKVTKQALDLYFG